MSFGVTFESEDGSATVVEEGASQADEKTGEGLREFTFVQDSILAGYRRVFDAAKSARGLLEQAARGEVVLTEEQSRTLRMYALVAQMRDLGADSIFAPDASLSEDLRFDDRAHGQAILDAAASLGSRVCSAASRGLAGLARWLGDRAR